MRRRAAPVKTFGRSCGLEARSTPVEGAEYHKIYLGVGHFCGGAGAFSGDRFSRGGGGGACHENIAENYIYWRDVLSDREAWLNLSSRSRLARPGRSRFGAPPRATRASGTPTRARAASRYAARLAYLSNGPSAVSPVSIATASNATINPYSIAVILTTNHSSFIAPSLCHAIS